MKIKSSKLLLCAAAVLLSATASQAATEGGLLAPFGFTNDWSLLELGQGNVQINNGSTVLGNMGVVDAQQVQINNGANVGTLTENSLNYATYQTQIQNGAKVTVLAPRDLTQDGVAANNATATFAAEHATSTLSSINLNGQSQSLTGGGVFSLSTFNLNNGAVLTLSGNASTTYVFNILGSYGVNNHSQVLLSGGVQADDVVYNIEGSQNVQVNNGSTVNGTILATKSSIQINNGSNTIAGAVITAGIQINNGSTISPEY